MCDLFIFFFLKCGFVPREQLTAKVNIFEPSLKDFCVALLGCGPAPELLAEDCFELGVLAYQAGRYGQGLDWLRMADKLTRHGRHEGAINHTEVLEHLAWVEFIVRQFKSLGDLIGRVRGW